MSIFRGDASDFYQAANDLSRIPVRAVGALRVTMGEAGKAFSEEWRGNARETSGEHGRFYPDSIDSELVFDAGGVSVDVGPNRAKKQGSMGKGFEFGSENQPPHLDGAKAMDSMESRVDRMIDATMGHVLS